jgi:hypothetical protein
MVPPRAYMVRQKPNRSQAWRDWVGVVVAEDEIRISREGVRRDMSVAELYRCEGIHPTIYYKWMKDFTEAGKGVWVGGMRSNALLEDTSDEVKVLRHFQSIVRSGGARAGQHFTKSDSRLHLPRSFSIIRRSRVCL